MSLPEQSQPERHDDVLEQGDDQGKRDVVPTPVAPLDSAGAWRIKAAPTPVPAPQAQPTPKSEPGDFTRMFELRQAPEPAPLPPPKPVQAAPASQPGEFTRAFQRPAATPVAAPAAVPAAGKAGDFTRMFQTPAPAAENAVPKGVPQPPVAMSHSSEPGIEDPPAAPARNRKVLLMAAILLLCAVAVFVLVRLY